MAFDEPLFRRKQDYECAKSGKIACPNSYCLAVCFRLDGDPRVDSFRFGVVRYPYFDPSSGLTRYRHFDFDVRQGKGRTLLFVTSQYYLHAHKEESQIEAAEAHADQIGARFELITEPELFGDNPGYMKSLLRYYTEKMWERFY
jgi:hypothetical protein